MRTLGAAVPLWTDPEVGLEDAVGAAFPGLPETLAWRPTGIGSIMMLALSGRQVRRSISGGKMAPGARIFTKTHGNLAIRSRTGGALTLTATVTMETSVGGGEGGTTTVREDGPDPTDTSCGTRTPHRPSRGMTTPPSGTTNPAGRTETPRRHGDAAAPKAWIQTNDLNGRRHHRPKGDGTSRKTMAWRP